MNEEEIRRRIEAERVEARKQRAAEFAALSPEEQAKRIDYIRRMAPRLCLCVPLYSGSEQKPDPSCADCGGTGFLDRDEGYIDEVIKAKPESRSDMEDTPW